MSLDLTFNDKEFIEALELYQKLTNKTAAEIINKKAKDVCFKAAESTPILLQPKMTPFNPTIKRWKGASKGEKKYSNRMFYAMENKTGKDPAKEWKRRKASSGYSKAIWYRIARDFGANLRGKFDIKTAKGKKAKPNNPVAVLDAKRLDSVHLTATMMPAFKKGMKIVERDTRGHVEKKLAEAAAKYSAE